MQFTTAQETPLNQQTTYIMGNGKISPIPKVFGKDFATMESSLADKGFIRMPGTTRSFLPYKEMNGKYRTGLDENAAYLYRLPEEQRLSEQKRIAADRERLETLTGLDLSSHSQYYNYGADLPEEKRVNLVKLGTTDKFFDLKNPYDEITWNWIKVHPNIAPSFESYQRGDVHPDHVQYYVSDDAIEEKLLYEKKQSVNQAIIGFTGMTPTKRRKVARLMGLPVSEDTKEETVYNLMDTLLKEGEFRAGEHKGLSTVKTFNEISNLQDARLHVKDLVEQSVKHTIYRMRTGGKIYEGENKIANSKSDLIDFLLDETNQEDLVALEKKLNIKKSLV